jgi:hypothetical protein
MPNARRSGWAAIEPTGCAGQPKHRLAPSALRAKLWSGRKPWRAAGTQGSAPSAVMLPSGGTNPRRGIMDGAGDLVEGRTVDVWRAVPGAAFLDDQDVPLGQDRPQETRPRC